MTNHYTKIEKFKCDYCDDEFVSELHAKSHIEFVKRYNNGLVCEPIPDYLKVIRVKHVNQKTYSLAMIVGFSYDYFHKVKIQLDRWCYNRDSFPEDEASNQCSISEIVLPKELHEYTLFQVMENGLKLTEDMVTEKED